MKINILFTFTFAFILCIFKANSAPNPVVTSTNGTTVRPGVNYYMDPNSADYGFAGSGTIGLAQVGNNDSCPAGVTHYQTDGHGKPFMITPVDPKESVIRLSTDVNIKYTGSSMCHQSNVWTLKYDSVMKQSFVMMGGVAGNPGPKTLSNWFKIEKSDDGYYKLVFCPSVCSYCKVKCGDIGETIDNNGIKRLVLGGDPLSFIFDN